MSTAPLSADLLIQDLTEISRQSYEPSGPFSARTTLHKPSHFPSPFDLSKQGEYLFVTNVGHHTVGGHAVFLHDDTKVELRIFAPAGVTVQDPGEIQCELARRLGFLMDIRSYESIWNEDEILSRLPRDMQGARPSSPFSLYEFLVVCTVLQNTTVARTVRMTQALAKNLGHAYRFPTGDVISSFWEPTALVNVGEAALREMRLGYRAKTLVRAAEHFLINPALETDLLARIQQPDDLRRQLSRIYGIGPASTGYIMFEWFKHADWFPHVSPWELKILSRILFNRPDVPAPELLSFCRERWSPYTMLAVHAVFESIFWRRVQGYGPEWLDELIRL